MTKLNAVFYGGKYSCKTFTHDELEQLEVTGRTEDYSELRAKGICCHREELDDQPKIEGYLGPMWDGDKLRYESQEVYDMLSN